MFCFWEFGKPTGLGCFALTVINAKHLPALAQVLISPRLVQSKGVFCVSVDVLKMRDSAQGPSLGSSRKNHGTSFHSSIKIRLLSPFEPRFSFLFQCSHFGASPSFAIPWERLPKCPNALNAKFKFLPMALLLFLRWFVVPEFKLATIVQIQRNYNKKFSNQLLRGKEEDQKMQCWHFWHSAASWECFSKVLIIMKQSRLFWIILVYRHSYKLMKSEQKVT